MGRDNSYQSELKIFQKELKESNQYMDWLCQYSLEHESISSNDSLSKDKMNPLDRKNISQLSLLFHSIKMFAKDNYLVPRKVEDGYYFPIKDREHHYYIGIDFSNGVQYYCIKNHLEEEEEIDYSYVRFQEKYPSAIMIDYYLGELECHIEDLARCGVPYQELQNRAFDTVRKIRVKK